jgi:hypothetical protein
MPYTTFLANPLEALRPRPLSRGPARALGRGRPSRRDIDGPPTGRRARRTPHRRRNGARSHPSLISRLNGLKNSGLARTRGSSFGSTAPLPQGPFGPSRIVVWHRTSSLMGVFGSIVGCCASSNSRMRRWVCSSFASRLQALIERRRPFGPRRVFEDERFWVTPARGSGHPGPSPHLPA